MHGIDYAGLSEQVGGMLNRFPAVGFGVGVVRDGELDFFSGQGYADLESHRPVSQQTVFRIASITKTFTAIGVMQLWERGLVDLDAPANDYLRAYRLVSDRPEFGPATVRHLLTHTSGVGETVHPTQALRADFGESVPPDRPLPTLGEYYRGALHVHAEPGTRWIYTDHGFATLGQIIEDVTGTALSKYLRDNVFEPLGMEDTSLVPWGARRSRLATGYTLRARGPRAVAHREWVTAGASSAYSSMTDMSRYLAALLGDGTNRYGSILRSDTLATMFAPHYQPDPRLPGMGLGFFRQDIGGHRAVEHQGILPGFNSQIWVAPDDGVGLIALTNGAHRAMLWMPGQTAGLLGRLLGVPDPILREDLPHHPEIWNEICGRYRMDGGLADIRARMAVGAGIDVRIRGGRPVLRVLTPIPALLRGLPLYPDDPKDPYAFRMDLSAFGIGTARVLFSRDADSGTPTVRFDILPMTLRKIGR